MEFEFTKVIYFVFKDRGNSFEGGCHTDFTFQIYLLCSCVCKHRRGCSSPSGTSRIIQERMCKVKINFIGKMCSCRGKTTVVVFLFFFLVSSHPLEGFSVSKNYIMHYKTFKQYKIFAPPFLFPKCHTSHQNEPLLIIGHFQIFQIIYTHISIHTYI